MRSEGRHMARLVRNDRGRLDLDLGAILDERGDLNGGHCGKILSHDLAIDLSDFRQTADVFALVNEVPNEVGDMLRSRAAAGEDGSNIAQRLRDLCDEIIALEQAVRVPADLSCEKDRSTLRDNAVGVACRPGPAFRLQGAVHERLLKRV